MSNNRTISADTNVQDETIVSANSTESQAQKQDSQSVSSATIGVTEQTMLGLYRLTPIAAPNDPNWDSAPSHGEVLVCAESPADARIVAAGRELDFMDIDAAPAEGVTTTNASAFRNERLYTVTRAGASPVGMARGVIEGEIRTDNITPSKL